MKQSHFRAWLQNKWMEYKKEVFCWDGTVVKHGPEVYFDHYKWFLKAQYKEEMKKK